MTRSTDHEYSEEIIMLQQSNLIEGEPAEGEALDDAIQAWHRVCFLDTITEEDILECHKLLMKSRTTLDEEDKGVWTRFQTTVGGRRNPEPKEIPSLMEDWIEKINEDIRLARNIAEDSSTTYEIEEDLENNEKKAQEYHVRFEKIHPFGDCNGRVGRLLLNWHRLQLGLPILIIWNDEKQDYYRLFRD